MAMLLWQDITGQTSEIVNKLADTSLPSLMAMAFVFAMMALPLYATYLIIRTIRTKPQDKKPDDNDTNSGLVSAIGTMAETFSSSMKDISKTMKQICATMANIDKNQHSEHAKTAQSLTELHRILVEIQTTAIKGIPDKILPGIGGIMQELQLQKGSVESMADRVGAQGNTIQQILDAILRLESQVNTIASDVKSFGDEVQGVKSKGERLETDIAQVQQKFDSIKTDVKKLTEEMPQNKTTNEEETKTDV